MYMDESVERVSQKLCEKMSENVPKIMNNIKKPQDSINSQKKSQKIKKKTTLTCIIYFTKNQR